jgi:serine/threonine-protein kinase
MTAIYLLTGRQPQQLETDSQTGEIVWRQYASHLSPMMAGVIDKAIAYHPRDRYPTARAMLEALQSIANPLPPTQLPFTQPPVVSAPFPETVNVAPPPQPTIQSNKQNHNILIGSLIAGGLIGTSIIISQVLTKTPQPVTETEVSISAKRTTKTPEAITDSSDSPASETPSNNTPPIQKTIVVSPTTSQAITTPEFTPAPNPPATTVDNYFWLSQRPVTDADLDGKDGFELDIMRNTIFAKNGRRFDTPGLQDYFNQQSWYSPQYSPKEFPAKLLSKLEQQNIDYIAKYQDKYNLRYFRK